MSRSSVFLAVILAFSIQARAETDSVSFDRIVSETALRLSETPVRDLPGWKRPNKILVRPIGDWNLADLEGVAPGVEFVEVRDPDEVIEHLEGAQALIGFCEERILAVPNELRWVQVYSSGVERCVQATGMKDGKHVLTNGQRIASPALGEHAIAMLLTLARGIDRFHVNQVDGEWKRNVGLENEDFFELGGRTLLVVGLGGIGTQVAKKAHGLGMRVIATRGSRREGPDYVDYVGLADEVNELAAAADVVVNTVPLTDRTRGMFDAAFFEAMKPTAYYISVGRGATTVTDDLVDALRNGKIAGAGLDVTDPEPLPEGHPLWNMPRVVITPHTGGRSDRSRDRLYELVKENLHRYVAGDALYSVVDVEKGY